MLRQLMMFLGVFGLCGINTVYAAENPTYNTFKESGTVFEAPKALNTWPSKDAAILPYAPGFTGKKVVNLHEMAGTHNEAVVIRGSFIKDGKIVIPPGGIYYTNRGPRQYMLRGDSLQMLGQLKYIASYDSYAGVLANKELKVGESYRVLPDKLIELLKITPKGNGHVTPVAEVAIIRPSGNYARAPQRITATPLTTDISLDEFKTSNLPTGVHPIESAHRFDLNNFTQSLGSEAGLYVKAGVPKVDSLEIVEAAVTAVDNLVLSSSMPEHGWYKAGDNVALGNYIAKVEGVDEKAGTATVSFTDKNGKKTEKVLGPMPDAIKEVSLSATIEPLLLFMLRSPDGTAQIEMSVQKPGGYIKDNQVALSFYKNLTVLNNGQEWPTDTRFIYRPDT